MSFKTNGGLGSRPAMTRVMDPSFWRRLASGCTRRAFLAAAGVAPATTGVFSVSRANSIPAPRRSIRWLAFYGPTADESILSSYDLVVLDPGYEGSIKLIRQSGTKVCGYLSLGEIRMSDPFLESIDPVALLPENPEWPGTRRVDVRHPSWRSVILARIPSLEAQDFTGLMLDTLDTPPYLELLDPVQYHGMRQAAIELVYCIRARWPELTLIVNRGYALLPDLIQNIDAVIAESLLTSPDQHTGKYTWVNSSQVELQLALLYPVAFRRLPILSLDYWDPDDVTTVAEIYRRERLIGHHPYVATRLLDQIVPEEH